MKRLLAALGGLALLALAALAAPALSTGRWRPAPVDFELVAPRGATASSGAVVSHPLRAPRRFNLVGLRWRGRSAPRVAIRTRPADGRFGRWVGLSTEAADGPDPGRGERQGADESAPAWVGEADYVQYRLSRRVPGLRLHFVNVEGTATAADRARTGLRRVVNAAVTSVAGLVGGSARAAAGEPAIVPRSGWGGDRYCKPRTAPEYGIVKTAFVHHTVNANDYSRAESPDVVLAICRYHRDSNGWNDIGYNFLVDRYGTIFEGRAGGMDQPVVGAQAQGFNAQSTGIANIGTFESAPQTAPALAAMARLIRWKLPLEGTPTYGRTTLRSAGGASSRFPAGRLVSLARIAGHRDVDATDCPGAALYRQLPALRRMVGRAGPRGAATLLTGLLSARSARYRGTVTVIGDLQDLRGDPLGGRVVRVERFVRGRWSTVATALTGADGRYRVAVRPRANRFLRAVFAGDASHRGSGSPPSLLLVRPVVRLTGLPARAGRGARLPVRGTVAPVKRRVWLVVKRRNGARWRRLVVRALRVRRGRFGTSFAPARSGVYRLYVVARADASTARGSSRPQLVRVGR